MPFNFFYLFSSCLVVATGFGIEEEKKKHHMR